MANLLTSWSRNSNFVVEVEEWDITNGAEFDLLREDVRKRILTNLRNGEYAAVLMSPPCGTWSRAPWANQLGPRPLRSASHPWGFPWLEGHRQKKVSDSNCFIRFCLEVLGIIHTEELLVKFWWEHPEDLGMVITYRRKARTMWFRRCTHKFDQPPFGNWKRSDSLKLFRALSQEPSISVSLKQPPQSLHGFGQIWRPSQFWVLKAGPN